MIRCWIIIAYKFLIEILCFRSDVLKPRYYILTVKFQGDMGYNNI
jgi:hypothetical protein